MIRLCRSVGFGSKKTDPERPWQGLETKVHPNALALFNVAMETQIGRGDKTLFWTDKLITGCSVADLAPLVVDAVSTNLQKNGQWHKLYLITHGRKTYNVVCR